MRFLPALILLGSLAAAPLMAQRGRIGRIGPPVGRFGAPQLPPGTYLNGVPGPQYPPGLNGLPAFSNRIYHFGCYGNNCNAGRSGRSRSYGGFAPFFGGYALPSYLPTVEDSFASAPEPPPVDPTATMLTNEIDQLRGEIAQMKAQTSQPPPPVPAAPAVQEPVAPSPPTPATVIVLRDGRRLETSNYAIMDQTLWNFSARPIQKIPVNSIDISASEKANAERGVDFSFAANSTK